MSGEYEPSDSRNVTGAASTPDGHWTGASPSTPDAAGQPQQQMADAAAPDAPVSTDMAESGRGFADDGGKVSDGIRQHMDVIGTDGATIGKVDSVDGDRIKLTAHDSPDGQHHYINVADVAGIENDQVHLHAEARALPGNDGS